MEKYCESCGRVFKDSDFKLCPYCGNQLSTRAGRQPIPRKLRHQVFQRDNYRCRECGATNKQTRLHVDHIVPVAKGGTNDLSNLQTLCEECNKAKYTDVWVGGEFNDDIDYIEEGADEKFTIDDAMQLIEYFKSDTQKRMGKIKKIGTQKGINERIDKWQICPNCNHKLAKTAKKCPYCNEILK